MHKQQERDRMGEEYRHIALADRQRAAELLLGQGAQDQADDAGGHRHVETRMPKPRMPMIHRIIRSTTLLLSV